MGGHRNDWGPTIYELQCESATLLISDSSLESLSPRRLQLSIVWFGQLHMGNSAVDPQMAGRQLGVVPRPLAQGIGAEPG
jgi:hypothetical protein